MKKVYFKATQTDTSGYTWHPWYADVEDIATTLANTNDFALIEWCYMYEVTKKYPHIKNLCGLARRLHALESDIYSGNYEDVPACVLGRLSDYVLDAYYALADAVARLDVSDIQPILARAVGSQVNGFTLQCLTEAEYLAE